jgi:hypothetical protein
MLVTHARFALRDKLKVLLSELQAAIPGELYSVDSREPGFEFIALHFGWYNKFSESVCFISLSLLSKTYID